MSTQVTFSELDAWLSLERSQELATIEVHVGEPGVESWVWLHEEASRQQGYSSLLKKQLAELRTAIYSEFWVYLLTKGWEIEEDVKSTVWLMGKDAMLDKLLCNVAANSFGDPSLV
jgi:hypothetical protein